MSQLSFDDFLKRVREADNRLLQELERVLIRSALRMERDGKLNATSYPKVRTGRLRSSITGLVDAPLGSPRVVLRAGGSTSGTDVDYAEYVRLVLVLSSLVCFWVGLSTQNLNVFLIGYLLFLMLLWEQIDG